jgi:hypothetical protein
VVNVALVPIVIGVVGPLKSKYCELGADVVREPAVTFNPRYWVVVDLLSVQVLPIPPLTMKQFVVATVNPDATVNAKLFPARVTPAPNEDVTDPPAIPEAVLPLIVKTYVANDI